jgi:hypothetical protein
MARSRGWGRFNRSLPEKTATIACTIMAHGGVNAAGIAPPDTDPGQGRRADVMRSVSPSRVGQPVTG